MTADTTLFLADSATSTAREIAELTLSYLGVRDKDISAAQFHTAADESAPFAVPADADYHGYLDQQGFPAWVRVITISEDVEQYVRDDYDDITLNETIEWASHRITFVHSHNNASERAVAGTIERLSRDYPLRWIDTDHHLHRQ